MTRSPYEVLGVSPNASKDDIKKAYRKKARENHPDLNPHDSHASDRMNEINEAYDRLMNPEKYAASDRRRAAQEGRNPYTNPYSRPYDPFGQESPFGGGRTTGNSSNSSGGSGYQERGPGGNPYGWTSTDFTWEDLFGFGFAGSNTTDPRNIHPEVSMNDSPEVRRAINDINAGRYVQAAATMANIPSTGRNARWYYIASLANYGAGNTSMAYEQILRACRIDPTNRDYQQARNAFQQPARTYEEQAAGRGFSINAAGCVPCCVGILMLNLCMNPYFLVACCR